MALHRFLGIIRARPKLTVSLEFPILRIVPLTLAAVFIKDTMNTNTLSLPFVALRAQPGTETQRAMEIQGLPRDPAEEWAFMLRFVGLDDAKKAAMSRSVETLFRRGTELVVNTYNYLASVPETAAILGWENGVDEAHLEERRRFFTVWLARTLGMDTSAEFAYYLFGAGKIHAGHGPRRTHVPPAYVTASVGLVQATFARFMQDAELPADVVAGAMDGWSRYLSVQINQMELGYRAATELDRGEVPVRITLFGRLRALVGTSERRLRVGKDAPMHEALRKFFAYYPKARAEALERIWHSHEDENSLWMETVEAYVPRGGWRILLNGRDVEYEEGLDVVLHAEDEVAIFPPGR